MNMRTSRLLAAASILVAISIVSCKRGETVIRTYDSEVEHVLEQSDSAGVTVSQGVEYLETFEGGKALCARINNLIVRFCYGDEWEAYENELKEILTEDQFKTWKENMNRRQQGQGRPGGYGPGGPGRGGFGGPGGAGGPGRGGFGGSNRGGFGGGGEWD